MKMISNGQQGVILETKLTQSSNSYPPSLYAEKTSFLTIGIKGLDLIWYAMKLGCDLIFGWSSEFSHTFTPRRPGYISFIIKSLQCSLEYRCKSRQPHSH